MRLDKYIASCTGMTRKEIKKALKKTPAVVSGLKVSAPETRVDEKTVIYFQGERLHYSEFTYILMNKPAGYVCTNREGQNPTVFSLLEGIPVNGLFTVGRLDKDTTGLLVITNDGDLSHRMVHAKRHVSKTYYLTTDLPIPHSAIEKFAAGVDIGDDTPTRPAHLEICPDDHSAYLTISEGRFHQVKRMLQAVGCTVMMLHRVSMGELTLDAGPEPGKFRYFNEKELDYVARIKEENRMSLPSDEG